MARNQSLTSSLSNPFVILKRPQPKKQDATTIPSTPIDSGAAPVVQSGFSIFNPIPVKDSMMSTTDADKMADKAKNTEALAEAKAAAKAKLVADKQALAEAKATAKAEAKAAREAKAAAKEAEKQALAEAKAKAKAAREAKAAELGPQNKMIALREAKKSYVKSATGQLRATDELAEALDAVPPNKVVPLAIALLQLPANPYERLNVGQQSMNLRNKLRGALNRKVLTIEQLITARDAGGYALTAEELAAKAPKPRTPKVAATTTVVAA